MMWRLWALGCTCLLAACNGDNSAGQSGQNNMASGAQSALQVASNPASSVADNTASVVIDTARGKVEVAKNPQRIAVYDWAALDTLTALGVNVGATTGSMRIDYLEPYFARAEKVGTVFEPDYEALNRYKPDLIITGGPGAVAFEQLAKIAPTIDLTVDNDNIRQSGIQRMHTLAAVFNKQSEAAKLQAQIDDAFAQARALVQPQQRALVVSVTGSKMSAFGAKARLSGWLHQDIGFAPAAETLSERGHGSPVSHEFIKQNNPDWLFILDRTVAMGQEGPAAKDVLDNPLVRETTAWRKGQVVVIPTANYVAAGGARQLLQAAEQVKQALQQAQGK